MTAWWSRKVGADLRAWAMAPRRAHPGEALRSLADELPDRLLEDIGVTRIGTMYRTIPDEEAADSAKCARRS